MDPNDDPMRFTPRLAMTGLTHHLGLSVFWCFGGVVLVWLAVLFVSRHGWRGRPAWFGAIAVTLPTGYFFFWGTYGAIRWGAPDYLGPYYYMPIFAPLIILGAGGFAYLVRAYGTTAKWALACMLVLSVFVTAQAVAKNQTFTADDRRLNTALDNADLHNALVFLPVADGPRILHPFATRRNNWNVTNDVIYAVDRSPGQNASVAADFSNRKLYELEIKGHLRGQPIDPNLTSVLHELTITRGKAIDITFDFKNPVNHRVMTVIVTDNGRASSYVIDRNSRKGKRQRFRLSLTPTGSKVTTPATKRASLVSTPADELLVQINVEGKDGAPEALYVQRWGIARRGNGVNLLMPSQVLTGYDIPPPVLNPH
jgi:hypothetical protein